LKDLFFFTIRKTDLSLKIRELVKKRVLRTYIELNDSEYKEFEKYFKNRYPDLYNRVITMENSELIICVAAKNFYKVRAVKFRNILPEDSLLAACINVAVFREEPELNYDEFLKLTKFSKKEEEDFFSARRQLFAVFDSEYLPIDAKEWITIVCDKSWYITIKFGLDSRTKIKNTALKLMDLIIENKVLNIYNNDFVGAVCLYIALELTGIKIDKEDYLPIRPSKLDEFRDLYKLIYDFFGADTLKNLV